MKTKKNNIKVYAVMNQERKGFDVYLDFSGQREYLLTHRNNYRLYNLLANGISIEGIQRAKQRELAQVVQIYRSWDKTNISRKTRTRKNHAQKIENSINYLLLNIEEFIKYEMDMEFPAA